MNNLIVALKIISAIGSLSWPHIPQIM